jgi:hypothetical protein
LLVLHFLLWIFRSWREFCEERFCIGVIEMKEEYCSWKIVMCIVFLFCLLRFVFVLISCKQEYIVLFDVQYYNFLPLMFSIHFFGK